MPDQVKHKGILRNKQAADSLSPELSNEQASSTSPVFDRNAVLENTKANAQLHTVGNAIIEKHKSEIQAEIENFKDRPTSDSNPSHLKWNEANLYLNEQEKSATMKITEPKTPFQGAVGDSEYYKPDDEDEELNDLEGEGLLLGESEIGPDSTLQDDRIIVDKDAKQSDDEDSEPEETPEEKHKRFEQLRKNHYFMKGAVLHKPVELDEDEE